MDNTYISCDSVSENQEEKKKNLLKEYFHDPSLCILVNGNWKIGESQPESEIGKMKDDEDLKKALKEYPVITHIRSPKEITLFKQAVAKEIKLHKVGTAGGNNNTKFIANNPQYFITNREDFVQNVFIVMKPVLESDESTRTQLSGQLQKFPEFLEKQSQQKEEHKKADDEEQYEREKNSNITDIDECYPDSPNIQFVLLKLNGCKLSSRYHKNELLIDNTSRFYSDGISNKGLIMKHFTLESNVTYTLIPHTYEYGEQGEFVIEVWVDANPTNLQTGGGGAIKLFEQQIKNLFEQEEEAVKLKKEEYEQKKLNEKADAQKIKERNQLEQLVNVTMRKRQQDNWELTEKEKQTRRHEQKDNNIEHKNELNRLELIKASKENNISCQITNYAPSFRFLGGKKRTKKYKRNKTKTKPKTKPKTKRTIHKNSKEKTISFL